VRLGSYWFHNISFGVIVFLSFELWAYVLLQRSGDIHTNPGPDSNSSEFSYSLSSSVNDIFESFKNSLSFVHYNLQSFPHNRDILQRELQHFDIISFTETWLSNNIESDSISFEKFSSPFKKDRLLIITVES
jgi:hypothetical protein